MFFVRNFRCLNLPIIICKSHLAYINRMCIGLQMWSCWCHLKIVWKEWKMSRTCQMSCITTNCCHVRARFCEANTAAYSAVTVCEAQWKLYLVHQSLVLLCSQIKTRPEDLDVPDTYKSQRRKYNLSHLGFHCIGPWADSVYRLQCPSIVFVIVVAVCRPLLESTLPGGLKTSSWRVYR